MRSKSFLPWFVKGAQLIITLIFFIAVYSLLSTLFAPYYQLDISLSSDHHDKVKVYQWNGLRKLQFQEEFSYTSIPYSPNKVQTVTIRHAPRSLKAIRIDPGEDSGIFHIYSLTLYNALIGKQTYSAKDIHEMFAANDQINRYTLEGDHIILESNSNDPSLTTEISLPFQYRIFIPALAALFSLMLHVAMGKHLRKHNFLSITNFPAFSDIDTKHPTEGQNLKALDGLRGLAAIFVLAEHATKRFDGLGGLGVCLFFSLSGFLLIKPFLKDSARILLPSYMAEFYLRRLKRILPIYSVYLFIVYFLSFRFDTFFRHLFFIQGDKHLWAMPQEMFFYLLIPAILLLFHLLKQVNIWAAIGLFPILMGIAHSGSFNISILHNDTLAMDITGNIGIFIGGMLASLILNEVINRKQESLFSGLKRFSGVCSLVLLLFFSLLASGVFNTKVYALSYPFTYDILAACLIFSVALSSGTFFNHLLTSKWLRAIGLVSYSFYIIHYLVIKLIESFFNFYLGIALNEITLLLLAGAISYIIASFSYSYIERPFIRPTLTVKPKK